MRISVQLDRATSPFASCLISIGPVHNETKRQRVAGRGCEARHDTFGKTIYVQRTRASFVLTRLIGGKQIQDRFVVDFHHSDEKLESLFPVLFPLLAFTPQLMHGARVHTWISTRPIHREGFPTARLAVRKDTRVKTIHRRDDHGLDFRENISLRGTSVKNPERCTHRRWYM